MSFAQERIKKVKDELIGFIKFESELICRAVNANTKDGVCTTEEDWKWNPAIEVPVDNSYLDVEDYCTERRKVVAIAIEGDKVIVTTEEKDEIYAENLSVEELGAICDCLAESFKSLTKN